jgi:hypothetical protein
MKLILFFLFFSNSVWSQGVGELYGTVLDETGMTIPLARVFVVSNEYDARTIIAAAESDFDGHFRITHIDVGTYKLVIQYYGKEEFTMDSIQINVDTITFLKEIRVKYPVFDCWYGLPPVIIKEPMDPFGRSITITSEDIKMR